MSRDFVGGQRKMKHFSAIFTIVDQRNCPLYAKDERLLLTEKTISCPQGKEVCLILVRDMTGLLFQFLQMPPEDFDDYAGKVFNCSGCSGLIKFALFAPASDGDNQSGVTARLDPGVDRARNLLLTSPLLAGLPGEQSDAVLAEFREITLDAGEVLIRRGEKNLNIYMVAEGGLEVEDGAPLASIGPGEICGETSYLGPDVAVATIRAVTKTVLCAVPGDVFGRLLGDNPAVQTEMARLLAVRLRRTNAARASDFEACMSGRIDQIVPAELLQIFHMHQKTGILTLELRGGIGKVAFREGCIINASYGRLRNEEAIFAVLAEKEGGYRFTTGLAPHEMKAAEIGDFMMLLMEGVRRVDEELG